MPESAPRLVAQEIVEVATPAAAATVAMAVVVAVAVGDATVPTSIGPALMKLPTPQSHLAPGVSLNQPGDVAFLVRLFGNWHFVVINACSVFEIV